MNRKLLKTNAKKLLNPNFKQLLILCSLLFAFQVLTVIIQTIGLASDGLYMMPFAIYFIISMSIFYLISIPVAFLSLGYNYLMLDVAREKDTFNHPENRLFMIFSRRYFKSSVCIALLTILYTFLWSLLFVIPGLIKSYSYSQAFFIYKDAIDNGETMTYNQAITASRQLMDGHKWELLVLQLSFILWGFGTGYSFGLLYLYVLPYQKITKVYFYIELRKSENQTATNEVTAQ